MNVRPFIGVGLGVEHRLGNHFLVALAADAAVGVSYRHFGVGPGQDERHVAVDDDALVRPAKLGSLTVGLLGIAAGCAFPS